MSQPIRGNPTLSATTPSVSAGCATTKNKAAPSLAIQVAPVGLEGVAKHARPSKSAVLTPSLSCVHHFLCEPANGPVSAGTCKHCGKTREFFNSEEQTLLTTTQAHRQKAGDAMRAKKGGARSAAQAVKFYGPVAENSEGKWIT